MFVNIDRANNKEYIQNPLLYNVCRSLARFIPVKIRAKIKEIIK
jgi:hypothetical protein